MLFAPEIGLSTYLLLSALGALVVAAIGVPLWLAWRIRGAARQQCSSCRAPLPRWRMPRTWHQALHGGWTCAACGRELDRQGLPRTPR